VALASNQGALAKIRSGLRERMANSPLCDGKVFTHGLEQAYLAKWQLYVEKRSAGSATTNSRTDYQSREKMSGALNSVVTGEDGPTSNSTVFRAPTPTEYAGVSLNRTTNSG
jgi:hypothetical protein